MTIPDQSRLISSSYIKEKAKELGFFDCGVSKAEHLINDGIRTDVWIEKGMHAEMHYMEKNKEKRYNPTKLVDGAKSVISVLHAYATNKKLTEKDNYKISNYAYGEDYHVVVKDKLFQLLKIIQEKTSKRNTKVFVDSAPVLDRAWANRSGLGFIGKNTMLINRKGGSYFFIGQIIIDLALDYNQKIAEKNFCGSCSLCLKACPTNALEPFQLDARKCISYQTIENKNEIPGKLKHKFEDWVFGCNICQDVCPWNRNAELHNEPRFNLPEEIMKMNKKDWLGLKEDKYEILFEKSAIRRTGYNGLKRNIRFIED